MVATIIVLAIAVVVLAVLAIWFWSQSRRTQHLKERFGPEYEQEVRRVGDRGKAEHELEGRQDRVERLHIRPLTADERAKFSDRWSKVQAEFVDDPGDAIRQADRLVSEVMRARGYPVGDFERRAADVSVDHPRVVSNYRAAHGVAERQEHGDASTDDVRQALLHYRDLFDELLGDATTTHADRREVA